MPTASRTVRHLRLRAADRGAAHRAALLFEDALRTASLPDGVGRLVLVRKLALGRIDSRAPPQTLALALERRMAQLATECVDATTHAAANAAAVWFRDALDAHTRLALRVASGDAADAWYWPLAVPAWRPGTSRAVALRAIALSVAALSEAPAALPQWAAALAAAGHVERLIAALRTEDVAALMQAARLRRAGIARYAERAMGTQAQRDTEHSAGTVADTSAAPEYADARLAFVPVRRDFDTDPRRALVRALLRAAGASGDGAIATPDLATLPDQLLRSNRARRVATAATPRAQTPGTPAASQTGLRTAPPAASIAALAHPNPRHDEPTSPRVPRAGVRHDPRRAQANVEPARGLPATDASADLSEGTGDLPLPTARGFAAPREDTSAGGLLFLLPVLQRLGYAEWLDAEPQWQRVHIVHRVLAAVLTRLHVAPEDPAWQLARCARIPRRAPSRFVAPPAWREQVANAAASPIASDHDGECRLWDGSGRLLLGAWRGPRPRALLPEWRRAQRTQAPAPARDRLAQVTEAWLVAVRRWLRRHAGIGLANLVLRPAALTCTPTHAELWFELRAVELRIRRAGLDLDPGWVPWFGRVVSFHYSEWRA